MAKRSTTPVVSEPIVQGPRKTKLELWNENPACAAWLNTPIGALFIEVLEEQHELRLNFALPPAFLTAHGTAVSGRVAGYERCVQTIRVMQNPSSDRLTPLTETYGVTKENATE